MNSIIALLVLKELRRKFVESSLTSSSQALVIEERRGRSRSKSVTKKDESRGKSKLGKDLRCYYCDKLIT